MITYLSSPKPFVGNTGLIQRNAIQSWLRTAADSEVILYGNMQETKDIDREMDIKYVPDIATNEYGTPLFGAIVEHAAAHAKHDIQVYVNCDIVFLPVILGAINSVHFSQFLMIGQRLDLAKGAEWNIDIPDWCMRLMSLAKSEQITLHPSAGSDFFVFRRGLWKDLTKLAIGRAGVDNVLIAYCLKRRIPVIDATFTIPAIHQFHEYDHISGGSNEVFMGKEASGNRSFFSPNFLVGIGDATWQLRGIRLYRATARGDWLRSLEVFLRLPSERKMLADCILFLRRIARYLKISKPHLLSIDEVIAEYKSACQN